LVGEGYGGVKETKLDSSQFSAIYTALIKELPLLPEHRLSLKAKRGFSDELIDRLQFRSCSSNTPMVIAKLDFTPAELRAAGILVHDEPNPKLLGDNILIPFFDGSNVKYIKPHKSALAGFKIQLYIPAPLKTFAIIAESEFKAAAALQLGYSALGVSGVSSFSGKHFPELVETLQKGGVTTCCIIFDNEMKDQKPYWDRWDTQYYSYMLAMKLELNGIETTIATLPDAWRVDGKADIDGALAMGKTKENFDLVVRARKNPADYLKTLPADAQVLIYRRFKRSRVTHPVFIDQGRYSTISSEEKPAQLISDFVFTIDNNVYGTDGECRRELTLVNDVGDRVSGVLFGSEDFSHPIAFKKKCMSLGSFQFTGGMKHLESVIAFESGREIGKKVYQPDHVGWIRPSETRPGCVYLFENGMVTEHGQRLPMDKDGIAWQGLDGFQAVSLAQGEQERTGIPRLWHEDIDPNKLIDDIQANFGGWHGVRLACSWLVASLFSHQLSLLYGSAFPLLFISGQQGSGKSTLCRWLCAMAGIHTEGSNYWSGTLVGFQRLASYYSSGPVWLDEYRNSQSDNSIKAKEGFLRGAYDGQSGAKGVRTPFGVRSAIVRGRIMLSGQDTPADQALLQRCIVIRLIQKQRTGEHYAELNRQIETFSGIIPELVKRFEQNKRKVVDEIEKFRKVLIAEGVDDRTAITYAIPVGIAEGIVRENDVDFYRSVIAQAKLSFASKEAEKPYRQFLQAMEVLELQEKVNGNCIRATNGGLAIHMNLAMQLWSEMLNRSKRDYPFKLETLYNEFEEAEILIAKTKSVRLKGGDARACCVLDPAKDDLVKQLFDRALEEM
jgi:hypothetical protein